MPRVFLTLLLACIAGTASAQLNIYTDPELVVFVGATHQDKIEAGSMHPREDYYLAKAEANVGTTLSFDVQYRLFRFDDAFDFGLGASIDVLKSVSGDGEVAPQMNTGDRSVGWAGFYGFGRFTLPSLRRASITPYLHMRGGWHLFIGAHGSTVVLENKRFSSIMSSKDLYYGGGVGVTISDTWFAEVLASRYRVDAVYLHHTGYRFDADIFADALSFRVGVNVVELLDL